MVHGPALTGDRFNYGTWQQILDFCVQRVDGLSSASCPFGFELFMDERYLNVLPRRLYVLATGSHSAALAPAADERLLGVILDTIKREDPALYDSIVLLRRSGTASQRLRQTGYTCLSTDRLLSVYVRLSKDHVLVDYARYLIAVLGGCYEGNLGELRRFDVDTRARRRFFQLFAMVDALVSRVVGLKDPLPPYQLDQDDEFQDFFDGKTESTPSTSEAEQLRLVALPRMRFLRDMLSARAARSDDAVVVQVPDVYGAQMLNQRVAESDYIALVDEVLRSHAWFCERSSEIAHAEA